MRALSVFIFLLFSVQAPLLQASRLSVIAPESVIQNYQTFLSRFPVLSLQTDAFELSQLSAKRDVAEMRILHLAVAQCDADTELVYRAQDNYRRILQSVLAGTADVSGTTVWKKDINERSALEYTAAIIADGDYAVGLYTLGDRHDLLAVRSLDQLSHYTVVSNRNWLKDWQVLEGMGFKELYHASSSRYMVRMVLAGRADFLLAQFPSAIGMTHEPGVETLKYVPEVKVVLPGSRHYAWRRGSKPELLGCVSEVLRKPEVKKEIQRLLSAAGVLYTEAIPWARLNP